MKLTNTANSSTLTCSAAELRALVLITSKDPARINLRGILIDAMGRAVAATDGHRMLVYDIPKREERDEHGALLFDEKPVDRHALLPRELAELAIKSAKKDTPLEITWTSPEPAPPEPEPAERPPKKPDRARAGGSMPPEPDKQFIPSIITIKVGNATVADRGLGVRFPPYQAVIPKRPKSFVNTISVGANYLKEIADSFGKIMDRASAPIELWMSADDHSPMIVQVHDDARGRWRYILMPVSYESNEPWAIAEAKPEEAKPEAPPEQATASTSAAETEPETASEPEAAPEPVFKDQEFSVVSDAAKEHALERVRAVRRKIREPQTKPAKKRRTAKSQKHPKKKGLHDRDIASRKNRTKAKVKNSAKRGRK